jgi:hypothetical protein
VNQTRTNVGAVTVTATLLDSNGGSFATASNAPYLSVLRPGEESSFDVVFAGRSSNPPSYTVDVSWRATEMDSNAKLEIVASASRIEEGDVWSVYGSVQNKGPNRVDLIAIVATLFDNADRVMAIAFGVPDAMPLDPGQISTFGLSTNVTEPGSLARYTIQAEGY